MLEVLRRPLSLPRLIAGVAVAALLVALYCVAYTSLAGRPETLAAGLGWAVANVCPWLIAIEVGKRAPAWPHVIATLAAALIASIALGYVLGVSDEALGFEAVRRLPALLGVAAIVTLIRSGRGLSREYKRAALAAAPDRLDPRGRQLCRTPRARPHDRASLVDQRDRAGTCRPRLRPHPPLDIRAARADRPGSPAGRRSRTTEPTQDRQALPGRLSRPEYFVPSSHALQADCVQLE